MAQLSSVLRSDKAVEVSIMIMDAFVAMRRFLAANAGMFQRIELLEKRQIATDQKIEDVLNCLEQGELREKDQFNAQYPRKPLTIKKWQTEQHDRWIIIDNELWHCGASIKDAGRRTFGFDPIGLDVEVILGQVR